MKKFELTEKQRNFLKKVGITAGVTATIGGAFYIFNRSNLGYAAKNWAIGFLQESLATKNKCVYHISIYGKKTYFTEDILEKAMDAACEILTPIAEQVKK